MDAALEVLRSCDAASWRAPDYFLSALAGAESIASDSLRTRNRAALLAIGAVVRAMGYACEFGRLSGRRDEIIWAGQMCGKMFDAAWTAAEAAAGRTGGKRPFMWPADQRKLKVPAAAVEEQLLADPRAHRTICLKHVLVKYIRYLQGMFRSWAFLAPYDEYFDYCDPHYTDPQDLYWWAYVESVKDLPEQCMQLPRRSPARWKAMFRFNEYKATLMSMVEENTFGAAAGDVTALRVYACMTVMHIIDADPGRRTESELVPLVFNANGEPSFSLPDGARVASHPRKRGTYTCLPEGYVAWVLKACATCKELLEHVNLAVKPRGGSFWEENKELLQWAQRVLQDAYMAEDQYYELRALLAAMTVHYSPGHGPVNSSPHNVARYEYFMTLFRLLLGCAVRSEYATTAWARLEANGCEEKHWPYATLDSAPGKSALVLIHDMVRQLWTQPPAVAGALQMTLAEIEERRASDDYMRKGAVAYDGNCSMVQLLERGSNSGPDGGAEGVSAD